MFPDIEMLADTEMLPDRAGPGGKRAPDRRAPDFFIVGHAKCGTTALYEMLRHHSQIYMPVKEPRFFAPELRSRFRRLGPGSCPETLDQYLALFAAASSEQRIGEASPQYIRSSSAASRIAEVQPDARIIVVLREPVSFLRSFHLQAVHNHAEMQKSFRKAIALEGVRRRGKRIPRLSASPPALLYSDHVRYVEQLRRYHSAFPCEHVLVLIYDDFRNDNEATVRKVQRFLGVDDTSTIEAVEIQSLVTVRFPRLHLLAAAVRMARRKATKVGPVSKTINLLTLSRRGNDALQTLWRRLVYGGPPAPDQEFIRELRCRFKPEVQALSEYLGRDLVSLWGYDRID
jgi:Sulfotransferase family